MPISIPSFFITVIATCAMAVPALAQTPSPQMYNYSCTYIGVPFSTSVSVNTAILRFPELLPFTDAAGNTHNVEFLMLNPRVLTISIASNPQDTNSGAPGSTIALPDHAIVCAPIPY